MGPDVLGFGSEKKKKRKKKKEENIPAEQTAEVHTASRTIQETWVQGKLVHNELQDPVQGAMEGRRRRKRARGGGFVPRFWDSVWKDKKKRERWLTIAHDPISARRNVFWGSLPRKQTTCVISVVYFSLCLSLLLFPHEQVFLSSSCQI